MPVAYIEINSSVQEELASQDNRIGFCQKSWYMIAADYLERLGLTIIAVRNDHIPTQVLQWHNKFIEPLKQLITSQEAPPEHQAAVDLAYYGLVIWRQLEEHPWIKGYVMKGEGSANIQLLACGCPEVLGRSLPEAMASEIKEQHKRLLHPIHM